MRLSDMKINDHGLITGLSAGSSYYRHNLLALGLTPGTKFTVSNFSPLGDLIAITIRGYILALRGCEADVLSVEKL
jgi:Fe2+ transport system protein FeoA